MAVQDDGSLEEGEIPQPPETISVESPQSMSLKSPPTKGKKKICTWSSLRSMVRPEVIPPLFRETTRTHVFWKTCSNPGFLEFMTKCYKEVHGEEINSDTLIVPFVRSCYLEYFKGTPVDHAAVHKSRLCEIQKLKRYLQKEANALDEQPSKDVMKEANRLDEQASPNFKNGANKLEEQASQNLKKNANKLKEESFPNLKRARSGMQDTRTRKRLHSVLKELALTRKKLQQAEARLSKAEKIYKTRIGSVGFVETKLEDLRGEPLGGAFGEDMKKKACPMCCHKFTSEGWYRLGSCGHEYHIQCLLLHAFCDRSCLVCKVEIPQEFYMSIGQEFFMPKLG